MAITKAQGLKLSKQQANTKIWLDYAKIAQSGTPTGEYRRINQAPQWVARMGNTTTIFKYMLSQDHDSLVLFQVFNEYSQQELYIYPLTDVLTDDNLITLGMKQKPLEEKLEGNKEELEDKSLAEPEVKEETKKAEPKEAETKKVPAKPKAKRTRTTHKTTAK